MSATQTKPRQAGRRYSQNRKRRPASDSKSHYWAVILGTCIVLLVSWVITKARENTDCTSWPTGNALIHVVTPDEIPQELIHYTGMDVSFNPDTHEPNWVAWELLGSETDGESGRHSKFYHDYNVDGCPFTEDYAGSGFDRGHMAPAGDMKWNQKAMEESFTMTNICPQAGELNRGSWKKLEEKCRQRAVTDSAIVIVCGPVFRPGEGFQRIGATGVAVPRQFFKVILSPYAPVPYAIGFLMPNGPTPGGMQAFAVPVDSVEAVTGYDFFSALPDELENRLESECNFQLFSKLPRRK